MSGKSYINVSGSLDALSHGTAGNLKGVQVEVTAQQREGRNNTHHNNIEIVVETKGKKGKNTLAKRRQHFCKVFVGNNFQPACRRRL